MGSKNVYMRDRFSGIAFDNSQVVGGGEAKWIGGMGLDPFCLQLEYH